MKKLVLALAVVACSMLANAAAFNWQAGNIYASDGATKYSGDVKLYCVIGGVDTLVSTVSTTTGAVAKTNSGFTNDNIAGGQFYDFYLVIEDNGKTFTSDKKNVSAQATATVTVNFGSLATATQSAANWKGGSEDVPEPTSGMLILFGLAGLALRRKRA